MSKDLRMLAISCVICLLLLPAGSAWSLFGGLSGKDSGASTPVENLSDAAVQSAVGSPRFEMKTTDDRFVLEAQIAKELSPLDACHHRVVAELQGTCSELSEEDLSKLSVRLLNCQSKVERRSIYVCTSDMKIADCTKDMDGTTWNAYQIVSNRARAICYAARQNHFRAKTEMTIDRLVSHSHEQLQTLQEMHSSQEKLQETAEGTLKRLEEGQDRIAAKQRLLTEEQAIVHSQITENLKEVKQEQSDIVAGNREIVRMTESISIKLDDTAQRIDAHTAAQTAHHQELTADLAHLHRSAQDVSEKLDASVEVVRELQGQAVEHYEQTLDRIRQVNNTIKYFVGMVTDMNNVVQTRLSWLLHAVGATGDHMTIFSTVALHVAYLVTAIFISAFINAPPSCRLFILLAVPINAAAIVRYEAGLTFTNLTLSIALSLIAYWAASRGITSNRTKRIRRMQGTAFSSHLAVDQDGVVLSDGLIGSDLNHTDIKRVIHALEKLCNDNRNSFLQSEGADLRPSCDVPCTPSSRRSRLLSSVEGQATPRQPANPPPSPEFEFSVTHSRNGNRMDSSARRRLMSNAECRRDRDSLPDRDSGVSEAMSERSVSPGPRASTPVRNRDRYSAASFRSNSLNRSRFRAPCLSSTKAGQPCKLMSAEGFDYCHRHLKNGSNDRNSSVSSSFVGGRGEVGLRNDGLCNSFDD